MNRNFGRLTEGELTYAPSSLVIDGRTILNPTAESYAAAGYLPVDASEPSEPAPEGFHYEPRGWEIFDDDSSPVARHIRRVWELVANPPPPPRRWTKLAIETALAQADMLDAMDAFLAQTTIVGKLTAARAFSRCDYIEEGYPDAEKWNALLDGAAAALGKTREEIDAFLDAIPTEG